MGYETKMFVISRSTLSPTELGLVDNRVVQVYQDRVVQVYQDKDTEPDYFYYAEDGNTRKRFPTGNSIIKAQWGQLIGMLDLCKCGRDTGGTCNFEDGDIFIYSEDGDNPVGLDAYGAYRKFVPIDEAIAYFEKELEGEYQYRRFTVALAMLKAVKEGWEGAEEVGVCYYGH